MFLMENFKFIYQSQNETKVFVLQIFPTNICIFQPFKILSLSLKKNQPFRELFQKRFATGICDLRGPTACIASHPIYLK